jgi:hypothetical protein
MINAGNPSVANLKMRKYVKEHKQSSSQIFEKLNRRGRLNPAQNAMSAQLTNEQLLRFFVKETVPKLQYNNDDIQGQGGDTNSVLMSEIQRLIDVGNFNAQDAKDTMNTIQNNLITQLQGGFDSVNDSIADNLAFVKTTIDDISDDLGKYASSNNSSSQSIISSLNDLNTKLEEYNTTGTTSQGALFASLANLQTALTNSNTNNAANTAAIDNLSIILDRMSAAPGIGLGGGGGGSTTSTTTTTTGGGASTTGSAGGAGGAGAGGSSSVAGAGGGSPTTAGGGGANLAATPAATLPSTLIPLLPPPPSPANAGRLAVIAAQAAIDALTAGSAVMTTSTTTCIQTLVNPIPNVDPLTGAKGGSDPNTVMVAGPKVPIDVGSFPEYDAIKAKNGGAELTVKDYREILKQVSIDLPNLFTEDLEKSRTPTGKLQKVETYINNLLKGDIAKYSRKILIEKYKLDDATRKLQEKSARSVLSKDYRNTKIATYELQDVMRRGIAANKYKDILNATIRKEKQISSATRIQTNFRSKLARQEFERQKLFMTPLSDIPLSGVIDPTSSFVTEADFEAFMNSFGV